MTWNESGNSVLKINIRELCLSGVWPLTDWKLFRAYSVLIWILGLENIVEGMVGIYLSHGDLEEITLVLPNTFTTAGGFFKMAFFLRDPYSYNVLVRLMDEVLSDSSQFSRDNQQMMSIAKEARRTAQRLSVFIYAFVTSHIALAFAGEGKLPFIQHPRINSTTSPAYGTMYALQCLSSGYHIYISLGMDCFSTGVMIHTTACLRILSLRITALLSDNVPSSEGSATGMCYGSGEPVTRDEMYKKLRACICSHQKIIGFISYLETVMNPIAMTQFGSSVLVACVALYQATYSDDMSVAGRCAVFLPTPGAQVFLYCRAAHNIMEQGQAVSAAAYDSSWLAGSSRFRRALRILMCRAEKLLVLTAGHLYPINKPAFLSVSSPSILLATFPLHLC
ncbi:odorant receptor 43a-like [Schistocerca serialis cubense]|uniref:odorant receptor 43a-like n=1 Tax=Schistocerca serialis cubense TaxID=2023355 RepID=UPI00214F038B|nr:odorant receptor 43a-like [Schistocerca serialis cubense]